MGQIESAFYALFRTLSDFELFFNPPKLTQKILKKCIRSIKKMFFLNGKLIHQPHGVDPPQPVVDPPGCAG